MFGIFRLFLSLFVVGYHLADLHPIGWYTVYAFYTLSGFLMTLVISKKYPCNPAGVADFITNRALRIYPPYLVMVLVTAVLLLVPAFHERASSGMDTISMPTSPGHWFQNIFIWGWRVRDPKLVPQAWTIFREFFFCALIFFPFARSRWLSLTALGCCLVYAITTITQAVPLLDVYRSFKNAALCYGAGCCLFHFQKQLRVLTRPIGPLLALIVIAPFALESIRPQWFAGNSVTPLYINAVFSSYLILLLASLRGSPHWVEIDRRLGNLSYPIYLCHYAVAITVAAVLGWPATMSHRLLFASLLPILGCAWIINRYVEQTVGYGYDQRRQTWSAKAKLAQNPIGFGPKLFGATLISTPAVEAQTSSQTADSR